MQSPVTNVPVYPWNVANRCFWNIPQLLQSLAPIPTWLETCIKFKYSIYFLIYFSCTQFFQLGFKKQFANDHILFNRFYIASQIFWNQGCTKIWGQNWTENTQKLISCAHSAWNGANAFLWLEFFLPLFLILKFYLSYLELNWRLIPSLFFFHTKFDQVLLLKLEFFYFVFCSGHLIDRCLMPFFSSIKVVLWESEYGGYY